VSTLAETLLKKETLNYDDVEKLIGLTLHGKKSLIIKFIHLYFKIILFVFQLAETLLKKETLNYDDVEKLIGPPPHGKKRLIGPEEFEQSVSDAAGEKPPQPQQPSAEKATA
jgi:hypothetical protein